MDYDIIIVGGGIVGQTFACALAQQTPLSIAILEAEHSPAWSVEHIHHRVSAISLSSQRIFRALGVWKGICEKRISVFRQIHVWDALGKGEIIFDSCEIAEPFLGYILENNVMQSALAECIKAYSQISVFPYTKLAVFSEDKEGINIHSTDGRCFKARLAIAADGAHSSLRSQASIDINKKEYAEEALVATVKTALPHEEVARQVFLKTGPLAFLPLRDPSLSSIVWTLPKDQAKELKELSCDQFKKELAQAFSFRLNEVIEVENRYSFPLAFQYAKKYVKSRVVLIGDAAHTVHPLAGQGVNMGLLDAALLVELLTLANKNGRDLAEGSLLRCYERSRVADNMTMLKIVNAMHELFMSEKKSIQRLRSWGLHFTHQTAWLKNMFTQYAVGNREGLPAIALKN